MNSPNNQNIAVLVDATLAKPKVTTVRISAEDPAKNNEKLADKIAIGLREKGIVLDYDTLIVDYGSSQKAYSARYIDNLALIKKLQELHRKNPEPTLPVQQAPVGRVLNRGKRLYNGFKFVGYSNSGQSAHLP